MTTVCRILLIEDDHQEAQAIERACCPEPASVAFDVVTNGADAEDAVRAREYDLIICDLALPSDARRFEPYTDEGLRLFQLIREQASGTPVIVLSGHADLHMMKRFFQASADRDLYGTLTEQPLVQFFEKEDLPDCVDAVQSHIARVAVLDQLDLDLPSGLELSLSEQRALRIYGRRTGATRARVESLAGGLSDAKTLKIAFTDAAGAGTGVVVAKLGDLPRVTREAARYEQVAARLPVGLGAHVLFVVQAGAGHKGALFYQLADEHTQSLFDLLAARDPGAVAATLRLKQRLEEWGADAPVVVRSVAELRRPLISDLAMQDAGVAADDRDLELKVRETTVHGDLHGLNVLVNQLGEPTLIDYGEVRMANAVLDPVTLELSVVYHPAMQGRLNGWPTVDQAARWADLDEFCIDCPIEEFVRACRSWAHSVSAGNDELLATAYAFSIRQAKYDNLSKPIALAVAESALNALRAGA